MTQARRLSRPTTAVEHGALLAKSVAFAQSLVLFAGLVAVAVGARLFIRDEHLLGVTIGVSGVTAAVTTYVVLSYIAWRVQQAVESEGVGQPP